MAQLPPKIPTTIIPNYHNNINNNNNNNISLAHHPPPPTNTTWADDFLDFSSSRRGAHRRSASDSLAFLDYQHDYDDVDAHLLLLSMFDTSPSAAVTSVNPTPPPDQDSSSSSTVVVIAKAEPAGGEVESGNHAYGDDEDDGGDPHAPPMPGGGDVYPFHDPKRVKRILANRQSAQRSRVRKLHYISELERSVTALQEEVSVLSPRVAYLDHQRLILNVDNGALKQRIAALAQDKIFKDAHQDALKKEIERLRQVMYHRQQQNQDQNSENGNHRRDAEQRVSSIPNDDEDDIDIDEKIGN